MPYAMPKFGETVMLSQENAYHLGNGINKNLEINGY